MADAYSKDDMDRRMKGAIATFKSELGGLRTGRASPALLDPVKVEAYGNMVPISQVGSIGTPESRMITVQVWDKGLAKADFVLMNPTHFAVAIRYDDKTMRAPQVVSKGADLLAFKIRDIAKDHAIPVLQSPMLARALYANAELDKDIPASLYTAVAQVLAYIYRLKAAMRGDGPMPGEPPQPFVPAELDPLSKVVANTVNP